MTLSLALPFWLRTGFSLRIGLGGKTLGVGGEGTTQAEGMTLGWVCMGTGTTCEILQISAFLLSSSSCRS